MSNARRPTTVTRVIPVPKDKVGHVIGRRGSRALERHGRTMSKCGKDNKGNRDGKSSLEGKRRAECLYLTQCLLNYQIAEQF